jgi:hypothetical protein
MSNAGRPLGAENKNYRAADHISCLEMARLRLADPALSIWQAAQTVAPQAAGFDGDTSHQGKTPRRLHDKYKKRERYFVARACEAARPQRPLSMVEIANQMAGVQSFLRSIQDSPLLQEEIRIRREEAIVRSLLNPLKPL